MSEEKKKDPWDVVTAVTPLIIGIGVTLVGTVFSQQYNSAQLQLNQLDALGKLRPLLESRDPATRAFAYESFSALGYQKLALKLIGIIGDPSGRDVVEELKTSGDPEIKAAAEAASIKIVTAEKSGKQPYEFALASLEPQTAAPFDQAKLQTYNQIMTDDQVAIKAYFDKKGGYSAANRDSLLMASGLPAGLLTDLKAATTEDDFFKVLKSDVTLIHPVAVGAAK